MLTRRIGRSKGCKVNTIENQKEGMCFFWWGRGGYVGETKTKED